MGRVDILTGTLGKALGGASGGYTSGRSEIVTMLRQRSRPYLFSNSVAPPIVGASLKALEICTRSTELRDRLEANTKFFRAAMTERKFNIVPGEHPITPIMIGDAALAGKMAERLLEKGVYAIGFFYPVVPQGKARVRVQVSAAHTPRGPRVRHRCVHQGARRAGYVTRRVGFAHRDGPMRATVPRKFTLVDATALIAATAVAFVPIRLFDNDPETHLGLQDSGWTLWSILLFGWELNLLMSPLVVAWSAALCLLRLRCPHPRLSRACRQPGTAACLAIVTAAIYYFVQYGLLVCFYHYEGG